MQKNAREMRRVVKNAKTTSQQDIPTNAAAKKKRLEKGAFDDGVKGYLISLGTLGICYYRN